MRADSFIAAWPPHADPARLEPLVMGLDTQRAPVDRAGRISGAASGLGHDGRSVASASLN